MFKRKPITAQLVNSIASAAEIRSTIAAASCPTCKQQTLQLVKYTKGAQGFEAEVTCTNMCGMQGVINSLGFEFRLGKPKATTQ